jgi:hypothetical protein
MAEPLTSSAALLTSYFVLTGGTWKLFDKVDDLVSKDAKEKASEWLRGDKSAEVMTARVSRIFSTAFDSLFGTRLFTFRAFGKSCLASLACVVLSFSIAATLHPRDFLAFARSDDLLSNLTTILIVGAILNFIPDYISLIKTRIFIGVLNRARSLLLMPVVLVADACISAALSVLALVVASLLLSQDIDWNAFIFEAFPRMLTLKFSSDEGRIPEGLFLYATFFTSFWLWLSALAAIMLRFGQLLASTRRLFTWLVKIDDKPFKAIGVASLGIETVVFAVLAVVVGIRSIWHA